MGKQLGHKIENGKTMFVYQALEAFKLWHNVEPKVNTDTFKLLEMIRLELGDIGSGKSFIAKSFGCQSF